MQGFGWRIFFPRSHFQAGASRVVAIFWKSARDWQITYYALFGQVASRCVRRVGLVYPNISGIKSNNSQLPLLGKNRAWARAAKN
jgi:hypothetical protein